MKTKKFSTGNEEKFLSRNPLAQVLVNNFFNTQIRLVRRTGARNIHKAGCGDGFNLEYLRNNLPEGISFSGSDIDGEMLRLAEKRLPASITMMRADAAAMPFPDENFDLVVLPEILEHMESPEGALLEARRITRKHAIFSVPDEPLWRIMNFCRGAYVKGFGNTPGHIQHWGRPAFRHFIGRHFKILATLYPTPWQMVLAVVE